MLSFSMLFAVLVVVAALVVAALVVLLWFSGRRGD